MNELVNVRPVLDLPVDWTRDSLECSYNARVYVETITRGTHQFFAKIVFGTENACWLTYVTLNGDLIYQSEHRERDEACGACVVAMQRALDVRHP